MYCHFVHDKLARCPQTLVGRVATGSPYASGALVEQRHLFGMNHNFVLGELHRGHSYLAFSQRHFGCRLFRIVAEVELGANITHAHVAAAHRHGHVRTLAHLEISLAVDTYVAVGDAETLRIAQLRTCVEPHGSAVGQHHLGSRA